MKKLLFILLLLVGGVTSYGQQYFNKVDPVHSFQATFNSVIERNGKYYCTGTCVDSTNSIDDSTYAYIPGIRFTIFDSIGNKIRDTFYQNEPRYTNMWNNNMYSLSNGDFVLVVSSYISDVSLYEIYGWVMRFDSMGNRVGNTEIPKQFCTANQDWELLDLAPTGTNEWIAMGVVRCGVQLDPVLTKLDSNFNVIWNKHFTMMMMNHNPQKIRVLDDGYLIGAGKTNYGLQWQYFFWNAELIKTDTAGVIQWSWLSDADSIIGDALDVLQTHDGGYVYCAQGGGVEVPTNSMSSNLEFHSWIEKLDANRNVVWNKYLSPFWGNPNNLIELEDGSLIVGGLVYSGFDDQDTVDTQFATLQKLSANGDIIWQRKYLSPNTIECRVEDVKRTSDGGFIIVGQENGYGGGGMEFGPGLAWVLKVDSNGCEQGAGVCNPTTVQNITEGRQTIKAYPNPAGNVLYIEGIKERSPYRLLSITGDVVRSGTFSSGINQLFLQDLPAGIYLLHTGVEVIKVIKE